MVGRMKRYMWWVGLSPVKYAIIKLAEERPGTYTDDELARAVRDVLQREGVEDPYWALSLWYFKQLNFVFRLFGVVLSRPNWREQPEVWELRLTSSEPYVPVGDRVHVTALWYLLNDYSQNGRLRVRVRAWYPTSISATSLMTLRDELEHVMLYRKGLRELDVAYPGAEDGLSWRVLLRYPIQAIVRASKAEGGSYTLGCSRVCLAKAVAELADGRYNTFELMLPGGVLEVGSLDEVRAVLAGEDVSPRRQLSWDDVGLLYYRAHVRLRKLSGYAPMVAKALAHKLMLRPWYAWDALLGEY